MAIAQRRSSGGFCVTEESYQDTLDQFWAVCTMGGSMRPTTSEYLTHKHQRYNPTVKMSIRQQDGHFGSSG